MFWCCAGCFYTKKGNGCSFSCQPSLQVNLFCVKLLLFGIVLHCFCGYSLKFTPTEKNLGIPGLYPAGFSDVRYFLLRRFCPVTNMFAFGDI